MKYKEVIKERLIEIIEEKDKLIEELKNIKNELQYQLDMDNVKVNDIFGHSEGDNILA